MLWVMLIVAEHFNLQGPGADVVYELSCYHNANLLRNQRTGVESDVIKRRKRLWNLLYFPESFRQEQLYYQGCQVFESNRS